MEIGTYLFGKNKLREQDNYFKNQTKEVTAWNTKQ